ncbi:MAG: hypothetical protein FWG85_06455 [Bacteroidetes bacterium]|nr:hypothetical protein [Bacteroidota bacterium]
MTKDEVKLNIAKIGKEIGANVPVLFGVAGIESNFNPSSKSKSGTYVGIYQLSNGWGGCKDDDRLDLAKSIKCFWYNHSTYQKRWAETGDKSWDDFYHYGIHQQGFAGFRDIYKNKNKLISEISEARQKSILSNKPSSLSWNKVSDWWDYFYKKFYANYDLAMPYINDNKGLQVVDNFLDKIGLNRSVNNWNTGQKVLIYGGGLILLSGIFCFIRERII